jgi:hypothetical protein
LPREFRLTEIACVSGAWLRVCSLVRRRDELNSEPFPPTGRQPAATKREIFK